MPNSQPTEKELLKAILEPLLEDFQYWFSRSRSLLESEPIPFLPAQEQGELLEQIKSTQKEVSAAQMLFKATEGQAGIDTATLVPWHQLVTRCWQVGMRWQSLKRDKQDESKS